MADDDHVISQFIDPKMSRKILQEASHQLAEEEKGGRAKAAAASVSKYVMHRGDVYIRY